MASPSTPRRGQSSRATALASPYDNGSEPDRSASAYLPVDSPISAADMLVRARRQQRQSMAAQSSLPTGEATANVRERESTPFRPRSGQTTTSLLSSPQREAAVRKSLAAVSPGKGSDEPSSSRLLSRASMGPPSSAPGPSTRRLFAPGTPTARAGGASEATAANRSTLSFMSQRRRRRSPSASSSASGASSTSSAAAARIKQRQRAFAAWGGAREESPMDLLRRLAGAPGMLPGSNDSMLRLSMPRSRSQTPTRGSRRTRESLSEMAAGTPRGNATPRSSAALVRQSIGGSTSFAFSDAGVARRLAQDSTAQRSLAQSMQDASYDADETTRSRAHLSRISFGKAADDELSVERMRTDDDQENTQTSPPAVQRPTMRNSALSLTERQQELERLLARDLDALTQIDEEDEAGLALEDAESTFRADISAGRSVDIGAQDRLPFDDTNEDTQLQSSRPSVTNTRAGPEIEFDNYLDEPAEQVVEPFAEDDERRDAIETPSRPDISHVFPVRNDGNAIEQARHQIRGQATEVTSSEQPRMHIQDHVAQARETTHDDGEADTSMRKELNAARLALLRKRRTRKKQQCISPLTGQTLPPLPSGLVRELFCAFATPSVSAGLNAYSSSTLSSASGKRSAKAKVERSALEAVEDLSHHFFAQFAHDLVLQAEHKPTPSTRITENDIVALLRAQGHVSERQPLSTLARKYLPRELSDLIVSDGDTVTTSKTAQSSQRKKRAEPVSPYASESPKKGDRPAKVTKKGRKGNGHIPREKDRSFDISG